MQNHSAIGRLGRIYDKSPGQPMRSGKGGVESIWLKSLNKEGLKDVSQHH